ncbi:hypothetical protein MRB53_014071 [Persea americana]|uniref:Uncharacterized protein n=1 Tax=Persea americana TaxID=3435 RepID=A0ACC2K9W1_PERAE|nr:hypothetical protein MRB53_014071 [Persea americana]
MISVGRTDCLLQRRDLSSGSVRRSSEDPNLLLVTAWENQSRGQKSEDFSRSKILKWQTTLVLVRWRRRCETFQSHRRHLVRPLNSMVHGALLAETLKRLEEIKECTKDLDGSTGHSRVSHTNSLGNTGGIQTRTMKLEFPRFDGANPTGWLFNAKRYFAYHQVPGAQWLAVASLKVEGEALDWYQWYTDYAPHATWKEFVEAMDARFGPTRSEDFVGKQSKLRQYSSVFEYQREFRRLSNRVKGLDEKILTSMYLSGLRDDIRIGVQKLNPSNLPVAFSLARLQEEEANLQRRRMLRMEVGRPTLAANPSELSMSYKNGEEEFQLKGIPAASTRVADPDEVAQIFKNSVHACALQLCNVALISSSDLRDPGLQKILADYEDVFADSKGLPPQRRQDHSRPLAEGTTPISVKP